MYRPNTKEEDEVAADRFDEVAGDDDAPPLLRGWAGLANARLVAERNGPRQGLAAIEHVVVPPAGATRGVVRVLMADRQFSLFTELAEQLSGISRQQTMANAFGNIPGYTRIVIMDIFEP